MGITPERIKELIKKHYSNARIGVKEAGKYRHPDGYIEKRYAIGATLFNSKIVFRLGMNLVLFIDGIPNKICERLSWRDLEEIELVVELWLEELEKYIIETKASAPEVKAFARKYLGKERKVVIKDNSRYIYYDKFIVVINPGSIFLVLKSSERVLRVWDLKDEGDLERIFSKIKFFAEGLREGKIGIREEKIK